MPEPGVAAKQTTGLHDSQKEVSHVHTFDTRTAHPIVLSHTLDAVTVEATRNLIDELRTNGHTVEETADIAVEHLAETVAGYASYTDPNYDPTDAELEVAWNAPDAPEAHRVAWALHQELHS